MMEIYYKAVHGVRPKTQNQKVIFMVRHDVQTSKPKNIWSKEEGGRCVTEGKQ